MRKLLIILFILLGVISYAQPFSYSGNVYGSEGVGIQNIPIKLYGRRTSTYDITYPTYPANPSYTSGTVIPSSDDVTHGPFNIGFTFNFFGNNYTQFYVGSNGWVGFSPGQTTGYVAQFLPTAGSPQNAILADWEDLFPGGSNIRYITEGIAPNRTLTVSFNAVPFYGCRSTTVTWQVVLYESSNVIDINYASKPQCGGSNATAGLVNINNTSVVPVGGKNASQWNVTNYSVRFTPAVSETEFSLKGIYYTNSNGYYSVVPNLDIQSYQFQLRIDSLNISNPQIIDAQAFNQKVLSQSFVAKDYYRMDVNEDNSLSVTDIYLIYLKNLNIGWKLGIPNYRIFTAAEWNVINASNSNLKNTYTGQQSVTITGLTNQGSTNFYLVRTGYNN